jgi:hypothetical protein
MIRQATSALYFALAGTALAAAQPDPEAGPSQGDAYISAGFTPDPFRIDLEGGGTYDASRLGEHCTGYVAQAPDFGLYYIAGTLPLIVSVDARSDTTLAIKSPDGAWRCDNDSGEGHNPSVRFEPPQTGFYDIWIGKLPGPGRIQARLTISELYSE